MSKALIACHGRIADQLGHADPAMTARVYLGCDPKGDKSSVAQHL